MRLICQYLNRPEPRLANPAQSMGERETGIRIGGKSQLNHYQECYAGSTPKEASLRLGRVGLHRN